MNHIPSQKEVAEEVPVFLDFVRYEAHSALADYLNAFVAIPLLCRDHNDGATRSILTSMKRTGIPSMPEYFCIKAISSGVSMDEGAIAIWKAFSEVEKGRYEDSLHARHLSKLPADVLLGIREMSGYAFAMTNRLAGIEIPSDTTIPFQAESLRNLAELHILCEKARILLYRIVHESTIKRTTSILESKETA